jgi:hypothetical protein
LRFIAVSSQRSALSFYARAGGRLKARLLAAEKAES